ncbi:MAG: thermonuclease family protein [Magnetococcales bacterium]|nr:thermonuclease family protein [Nitrospirota bacterium]
MAWQYEKCPRMMNKGLRRRSRCIETKKDVVLSVVLSIVLGVFVCNLNYVYAFEGTVERVIDGDTVVVRSKKTKESKKVRVYGIDSPEKKESYGDKSTKEMEKLLPEGKTVEVNEKGKDKYGRTVGKIKRRNEDVGLEMIEKGAAKTYPYYLEENDKEKYLKKERKAQEKKSGLWEEEQTKSDRKRSHSRKNKD